MNKNEIIQIQGMEYKEMTKQLLNKCALATLIPSKVSLIGIKPNLVAPVPAEFGGTTHPEVVAGIIEYLQENGFTNLQIMEGSWVGNKTYAFGTVRRSAYRCAEGKKHAGAVW